jgi:L-fucose isomerase-like protein
MKKLTIKLLTFPGAPENIFNEGKERLKKLLNDTDYEFVTAEADVLFFLSGGSERLAINTDFSSHLTILLASEWNNAYASASEVKAYLNKKNIPSLLLNLNDSSTMSVLKNLHTIKNGIHRLSKQKLGLIGKVSDWLVASSISAEVLAKKTGIRLQQIEWANLPDFNDFPVSEEFLKYYSNEKTFDLTGTAKIHQLLQDTILNNKLDAITVECFSLVQKNAVTACLSLAKLNADGFPAGCEGDIVTVTGMMLLKELTGIVPWIANINKVVDNSALFSHCTIAPSLVKNYSIHTHFETNKGSAIQGDFIEDTVTIFRLDNELKKAFFTKAEIINRPHYVNVCRTQIEVKLPDGVDRKLIDQPLGNHHLILPGDHTKILELTCRYLDIVVV